MNETINRREALEALGKLIESLDELEKAAPGAQSMLGISGPDWEAVNRLGLFAEAPVSIVDALAASSHCRRRVLGNYAEMERRIWHELLLNCLKAVKE